MSGKIRPNRRAGKVAGFVDADGVSKKIAIRFDDETFEQVAAIAAKRGVSFGSVVRELVEFGLLDGAEAA